uniref:Uncharacterized protein n=1 Tax=Anguilla anguilla TaxID=7936 RepID=A0A0E9TN17_ANGAN
MLIMCTLNGLCGHVIDDIAQAAVFCGAAGCC